MKFKELFDLEKTIAKKIFDNVDYPWEGLTNLNDFIVQIGNTLPDDKYIKKCDNIWIAKNATISSNVTIIGPCIIDENAEIRHCAFIRENVIVGKNVIVGNSTELKNSILFDEVQVPHFNYIGDSILGYKVHLGAGAITSNIKTDKTIINIKNGEEVIETKLQKLGAVVGDNVEIGCNSVLCPGTIIFNDTTIYPLQMVRGIVPEKSVYKNKDEIVEKI